MTNFVYFYYNLQYYVIQDNVQLFPSNEYEYLHENKYSDVDGPSYRLSVEDSIRHKGRIYEICVDLCNEI